jgi:hypothetical protein
VDESAPFGHIIVKYALRNYEIIARLPQDRSIKNLQKLKSKPFFIQKVKAHILEDFYIICEHPCPAPMHTLAPIRCGVNVYLWLILVLVSDYSIKLE